MAKQHALATLMRERIATGLRRSSITRPSTWAEQYRIMGEPVTGPWSFRYHPWARELHDVASEMVVGQKAAQMAYTETALNRAFYHIDVKGESVLYILPNLSPDASDFSTSRFDPALEASPHLANLFSDVKNIGHKRAGTANLYIRGSKSRPGLKSIPVSFIIMDELDEFAQENISLALERMSGQFSRQCFQLSTPTVEGYGINAAFQGSSQRFFTFQCPSCSKWIELTFPDCLIITSDNPSDPAIFESHLVCPECKNVLPHAGKPDYLVKGKWEPRFPGRVVEGYHINQLYSCVYEPYMIAQFYLRSLTNQTDEQEFYNSKLGLPHTVANARVSDTDIDACIGEYTSEAHYKGGKFVTMGIDVGSFLHYEIDEWIIPPQTAISDINLSARCRVLKIGKVAQFEELYPLIADMRVHFVVIDHQPETRKAVELANRFYGHVRLCHYGNAVKAKRMTISSKDDHMVTLDRTTWLDLALARFHNQTITLPKDLPFEYREHIKALVRHYDKDKDGNPRGSYKCGTGADHYAHARNYAEIALPLGISVGTNQDISGIL